MVSGIALPIAAAWLYMSDDTNYNNIPSSWSAIDFCKVDTVYVGPVGVQANGSFGLYDSATTGPLSNRFNWVIETARSQNPNIKIIASQWWGSGASSWGSALSSLQNSTAITNYANSVQGFLNNWLSVSGGIDGYDIDYESNNVNQNVVQILSQVRSNLDTLSSNNGGRQFYVTVSPSETTYLQQAVPSVDFVNMQTYSGGIDLTTQDFLDIGLKSSQLLYGIDPENDSQSHTVSEVEQAYESDNLAGIHLYRLNSDDYQHELQEQEQIYSFLHPSS